MSDADPGDGSSDLPMTGASLEALRSRIADLESTVTDQRERIDELEQQLREDVAGLSNRLDDVAADVDGLASVADATRSTPGQRAIALARKLQTAARARATDDDPGRVAWTYTTVIDQLEADGHGRVWPAQAYDAMADAANCTGITAAENTAGDRVVRCNSARLNGQRPVNDINNAGPAQGGQNDPDNTTTVGDN